MHKRLLIIGTVPYDKQMTSRAFDSYFHNWEKENLAQIFSNQQEPLKGHCGTLFQITDKMMLKRRVKKNENTGIIYYYKNLKKERKIGNVQGNNGIIDKLYSLGKRKFPLNYLLRGILWKKKYWCTEKLLQWADDFSPECIFLAFSDDFFIPEIALFFAERYDIPLISCIGDDYYFNDRFSVSPFYYIYRKKYKKLIDRVFAHGGSAAYIGDKIRDKYNSEFNLDGETVYLTSEIERQPFRMINTTNPKITYCGNIRLGRNKSLAEVADVLAEINPDYHLEIYSNEKVDKYISVLKNHKNIDYLGTVPYEIVKRKTVDSDIVVVVEGFDKKDVDITRYSLSTKVADSLASGRFVLGYGSAECGAIDYLLKYECGLTCTSYDELLTKLKKVVFDADYQKQVYDTSERICNEHHTLENSNLIFEKIVNKAIRNYTKSNVKE